MRPGEASVWVGAAVGRRSWDGSSVARRLGGIKGERVARLVAARGLL